MCIQIKIMKSLLMCFLQAGIESRRSRSIGVSPSDTGQTGGLQRPSKGPPSAARPQPFIQGLGSARGLTISGTEQTPGTGRPWETMPGRVESRSGDPGQMPGTGRPWETMPGRVESRSGDPGQMPGTGRPWETMPGRVESRSGGPGLGTERQRETMPGPGTSSVSGIR